jgi:hypothetical protein
VSCIISISNRGRKPPRKERDMASSEAHKKAAIKYAVKNTTRVHIALNNTTDKDIIDHLETVGNKQGYIKELIRKDMR